MYKEIFNNLIGNELRYMSTGWTRIHPYKNSYESHSINVGKYSCSPADIFFELGYNLDKTIRLRCECKNIDGYEIYRLKSDLVESDKNQLKSQISIQVGERIKSIQIFETYHYENVDIKKLNTNEYSPNGLLIEFESCNYLGIWGQEGDDQCEPCHYIKFIPSDEIEIYRIEWMKKWKLFDEYK